MDDLLKEAIADAKAVRETALENAKLALQEAFTPKLQNMLSQKIQMEMEDEEGEEVAEMEDEEAMEEDEMEAPAEEPAEEPAMEEDEEEMDPEMEEMPTDYLKGVDFRVTKTTKGGYADYSTSKWSRRERPLDEAERAAIETHGLHNLGDFRPKEPTEAEVKIIAELFAKSVEGEAYDLEQYGQYFRPAGVAYQGKPQVAVPTASAPVQPVAEAAPTAAPVTESAPAPQPTAAPATAAPTGDSAKRAEDILKLIRSRQAK